MDTERIKSSKPAQAKGGKDSTKIVLTAAGAVAVGAGAAVAANEWNNDAPEEQTPSQTVSEENVQENTQETTPEQSSQQTEQQSTGGNHGQQSQQTNNEIHPVDNNQTVETVNQNTTPTHQTDNETEQVVPENEVPTNNPVDEVDPDLIAQGIIGEEIDPNDVDVADMVIIDGVDTYYMEDGTEVPVALVHDEYDDQYLMVDIDDDMTFDMLVDLEGNPVAPVDGNLTMSDVLDMADETGGELAYNAEQIEQELKDSEDPEQDIIDTNDLAMLDNDSEEMDTITPISDEEFEGIGEDADDDDDNDLAEAETEEDDEIIDDLDA